MKKNVKLVHHDSKEPDELRELHLSWKEAAQEITTYQDHFRNLVDWRISGSEIILTPRPEALGVFEIAGHRVEVIPKYMDQSSSKDARYISNIFFVTQKRSKSDMTIIKSELILSEQELGICDYYFYLVYEHIYDFLRRYDRKVHISLTEETQGVRGTIKPIESLRRFKGLKHAHICEVPDTKRRVELLGLIKGFTSQTLKLVMNPSVASRGNQILRFLDDIVTLNFERKRFVNLRRVSRQIVSECRQAQSVIDSLNGLFEAVDCGVGSVSHRSFSFNMNQQFEILVEEVCKLYSQKKKLEFNSGNSVPLRLLNGSSSGLGLIHSDSEFVGKSIAIRPDIFLVDPSNESLHVIDAKYKFLSYSPAENEFQGVSAKDVQQLLTYWMHFIETGMKNVSLSLIYPRLSSQASGESIIKAGHYTFCDPRGSGKIVIEIFLVDISKIIENLSSISVNRKVSETGEYDWLLPISFGSQ